MNTIIEQYFDSIETCLIESDAVHSYQIIRRKISSIDGKLRAKIFLKNNSTLEFFLHVLNAGKEIKQSKYSFHWQDQQSKLIKRWDNAPHHPHLKNFPHHVHIQHDLVESSLTIPDIFFVIDQIKITLNELT